VINKFLQERAEMFVCSAALRYTDEVGMGMDESEALAAAMIKVGLENLLSMSATQQEIIQFFCALYHEVCAEEREGQGHPANDESPEEVLRVIG